MFSTLSLHMFFSMNSKLARNLAPGGGHGESTILSDALAPSPLEVVVVDSEVVEKSGNKM